MNFEQVFSEINKLSNKKRAKLLQKYFKTGKGDYAEGDVFIGLNVPQVRLVAKKHQELEQKWISKLLNSKIHEARLCALFILTHQFNKGDTQQKTSIYNFYLKNIRNINNWDLVDQSAPRILGAYLSNRNKSILYKLAHSRDLWEKRIAIISTLYFIVKDKKFDDTLKICELLIKDKHDLIHKACGWMLREVGKKDKSVLIQFLIKNYKEMPRTMLRYAIERFPEQERKAYLKGMVK